MSFLKLCTSLVCLCLWLPLSACLNDRETQSYEEEFKSEYLQQEQRGDEVDVAVPEGIALIKPYAMTILNVFSAVGILFVVFLAVRSDISVFNGT